MNYFLSLFLVFTFINSFSQSDSITNGRLCRDSLVNSFKNVTCLEERDTIFDWIVKFDSVEIILYDRWGEKMRCSNDPYIIGSEFFRHFNNDDKLTIGTYFLVIKSFLNDKQMTDCNYIYLSKNCPCG